MAHMYPETPDADAPDSERKVFAALRDQLPDDFSVLHSKRYFLPATEVKGHNEGESDFLVFDPRRGFLVLEVKGGGIERDQSGQWHTINKRGRFLIQDPGKQAQRSAHSISRLLKDHQAFRNIHVPPHNWGVAFPDVEASMDLGPEFNAMVGDRASLRDIPRAINGVFDAKNIKPNDDARKAQHAFLKALAPSCRLVPTLASRLDDEYPVLVRLTEEQMDILDMMADFNRLAVKGSAGTGKTLVAMERARRLTEQGQRVMFMCYNRQLAEHLADRAEGFTVTTFHAFARQMAKTGGIKFDPPRESKAAQKFWDEEAPDLLDQAIEAYPDDRWDAVIVDEGQDFKELWWLPIEKLLKDPRKSSLWVFYDPNQDIFGGGPTETLGLQAASLIHNCRNTKNIAAYSFKFVQIEPKMKADAPDGIAVQELSVSGQAEMIDAVRRSLNHIITEQGVSSDRILILSPNSTQNSDVMRVGKFGKISLVEIPNKPGPNQVQFSSLGRFKGLDQDVVILCELRPGKLNATDKHLYVGTSRARLVLIVLRYAD